jgi:hypothetical protein
MAQSIWIDPFLGWCLLFVALCAIADFLIGVNGRKQIQDALESGWIKFDDIKPRQAFQAEARIWLALFEKIFGERLVSYHRLFACVAGVALVYALVYVASEFERLRLGLPFRYPGSRDHLVTNPLATFLFFYVGVAVTHWISRWSVSRMGTSLGATLFAIITLVVTLIVSVLTMVVTDILLKQVIVYWMCQIPSLGRCEELRATASDDAMRTYAHETLRGIESVLADPAWVGRYLHYGFQSLVVGKSSYIYTVACSYSIIVLRCGAVLLFIFAWGLRRFAHATCSLVLYRLAEAEKGVLLLVASALTGLAKLLQMAIKSI